VPTQLRSERTSCSGSCRYEITKEGEEQNKAEEDNLGSKGEPTCLRWLKGEFDVRADAGDVSRRVLLPLRENFQIESLAPQFIQ
jgi:hypothetical protein